MLTNEKYDFPVFILVDGINMGEITWQIHPYTIDFMRITIVQSVITDAPQILHTRKRQKQHNSTNKPTREKKRENKKTNDNNVNACILSFICEIIASYYS